MRYTTRPSKDKPSDTPRTAANSKSRSRPNGSNDTSDRSRRTVSPSAKIRTGCSISKTPRYTRNGSDIRTP